MFGPQQIFQMLSGMDFSQIAGMFGAKMRTVKGQEIVQAMGFLGEAAALGRDVEVVYITGTFKGQNVRILAVKGDFPDEIQQQLSS